MQSIKGINHLENGAKEKRAIILTRICLMEVE
jgi:hypothetical protein